VFLVLGVLRVVRHTDEDWSSWAWLALGPLWFLSAYVQYRRRRSQ
jgi:hypothetical protein